MKLSVLDPQQFTHCPVPPKLPRPPFSPSTPTPLIHIYTFDVMKLSVLDPQQLAHFPALLNYPVHSDASDSYLYL